MKMAVKTQRLTLRTTYRAQTPKSKGKIYQYVMDKPMKIMEMKINKLFKSTQ